MCKSMHACYIRYFVKMGFLLHYIDIKITSAQRKPVLAGISELEYPGIHHCGVDIIVNFTYYAGCVLTFVRGT